MQTFPVPILPAQSRARPRTALVASADRSFRQRLSQILTGLRWQVREAEGGAQAWAEAEAAQPEAVIVDSWLPDLELREFLSDFRASFPGVDVVTADGSIAEESPRGPYRQELLYAIRRSQETPTRRRGTLLPRLMGQQPSWNCHGPARTGEPAATDFAAAHSVTPARGAAQMAVSLPVGAQKAIPIRPAQSASVSEADCADRLPELIGNAACMLEVSRRVRLVAPRMTPVLIEGPTGSGKETGGRGSASALFAQPQASCGYQLRRHS